MENNIRFAFAISDDGIFEKEHFGSADKYMIYEMNTNGLVFISEKENSFKEMDESGKHGLAAKGEAISTFLRNKNVKVLVSRQFGKNIKLINKYFIPILIYEESPEQAGKILYKYIDWIKDELNDKETGFKLFTIKNGILKSKL